MSKSIKEGVKTTCPECGLYAAKKYLDGTITCFSTDKLSMCSISSYRTEHHNTKGIQLGNGYECGKPEPKSDKELEEILEYYRNYINSL